MASEPVDVEAIVQRIQPRARRSPVVGFEHQRGWGVLAFPFDSRHVLALRVSPQNDFAPFVSIWHRTPDGTWSIYVDGPRLDTACPRYWGAETDHARLTGISIEWTGPQSFVVEMTAPRLRWTVSLSAGPLVRAVNAVTRTVPESLLRTWPSIRLAEWLGDSLFDLGDITLATTVPNGHEALLVTEQLFPIVDGRARLDGVDLGDPAALPDNPTFGVARLPARPVFTVGPGYLTIVDEDEYEAAVASARRDARSGDSGDSRSDPGVEVARS